MVKLQDEVVYSCVKVISSLIRPSVDGLYRDGTVLISREQHKQYLLTRHETTSGTLKPHKHRLAYGPFSSHRNALRVIMNLRLSTREIAHAKSEFRKQPSTS